jgi:iron complex transport system permease protein
MKQKQRLLQTSRPAFWISLLVLLGFLVFSLLFAVSIGSVRIPIGDVYGVIIENIKNWFIHLFTGEPFSFAGGTVGDVVWFIRLPRLILALAIGVGLSVCGVIMQAVVKNPLAEPYVLGISSGASLGATSAILLGIGTALGSNFVGIMACIGAFIISVGVVGISNIGGKSNSVKLLLAGMALSAVCSAFSNLIIYFAHDKEGIESITYWMMGSMAGASWSKIAVALPISFIGTLFFLSQCRTLNLMLLGDETAITLGKDLHRWRQLYLLVSAAIVGIAVYSAGMIGFVGLVVPHVMRMLYGTDHRRLLPASALAGAILLVWADIGCRVLIPGMELPIGLLTSIIGAPCFIYLMVRKRYGFGGGD